MINFIKKYCFFCSIFFQTGIVAGQDYSDNSLTSYVTDFQVKDGLSQSNVNAVIKDSEGFIWVGTDDGLNRFDGYDFKVFRSIPGDSTSLSDNKVLSLIEDSQKRIWVGTISGLNLLDKKTETFKRFYHDPDVDNTISHNSILCLKEDPDNNLWFGTYWGLNKMDYDNNKIDRFYYSPDGWGIRDNVVNAIEVYQDSLRWIGTSNGVTLMNKEGLILNFYSEHAEILNNYFADYFITDIALDGDNNLWFGTNTNGLLRYSPDTKQVVQYKHSQSDPYSLSSNYVSDIMINKKGEVWISTNERGVSVYNPKRNNFLRVTPKNDAGFATTAVNKLFDDHNKLWAGTYGSGLKLLNLTDNKFAHIDNFDVFSRQTGKNSVLSIAEDPDKNIWIGTDGAGLFRYTPSTGKIKAFRHDPDNQNTISGNIIKSLLADGKGNIYIGTYAHGLNILNNKTGKIKRYRPNPKDGSALSGPHVWDIYEDKDARIWIGTLGDGLNEFIPQKGVFIHHQLTDSGTGENISEFITKIFEDSDRNLWIGTIGGGISKLDKKTNRFTNYTPSYDTHSISLTEVIDIYESEDKTLWVGSKGGGLFRYRKESDDFVPTGRDENIPATIQAILEDEEGFLWLSSYQGVTRYNPAKNLSEASFDIFDGLQGREFNTRSKLRGSDGNYYFGGPNGLNIFKPANIYKSKNFPPVVFTNFYLFHKVVNPSHPSGPLKGHINYERDITLLAKENVFSIQFAAIDYTFPRKTRYAYFLEGFDKSYNYVDDNRLATYTNIPPGTYTFHVKSTNNDGLWNEESTSLVLKVLPPWYRIGWVQAILLLAGLGLVMGIIKFRTQYLSRQKNLLLEMVKERTRQIEKQKDEIEKKNRELETQNGQIKASNGRIKKQNAELIQKNAEIMAQRAQINEKSQLLELAHKEVQIANKELIKVNNNLEQMVEKRTAELQQAIKKLIKTDEGLNTFLYRSSHDLRGPITTLLGLVQLAEKENKQEHIKEYIDKIRYSCLQMLRFLKKLNDTNVVFRTEKQVEIINWNKMLSEIFTELEKLDKERHVAVIVENEIEDTLYSDELLIQTIIHNLMENAIIYRRNHNPYVKLQIRYHHKELTIRVTDNGISIDKKLEDKIFDMFFRGTEHSHGNGLGLFLVKKAVEMLDGNIELSSGKEQKEFLVSIPIAHATKTNRQKTIHYSLPDVPRNKTYN